MSKKNSGVSKERFETIEMKFPELARITKVLLSEDGIRMISDDHEAIPESSSFVKFYKRDSAWYIEERKAALCYNVLVDATW